MEDYNHSLIPRPDGAATGNMLNQLEDQQMAAPAIIDGRLEDIDKSNNDELEKLRQANRELRTECAQLRMALHQTQDMHRETKDMLQVEVGKAKNEASTLREAVKQLERMVLEKNTKIKGHKLKIMEQEQRIDRLFSWFKRFSDHPKNDISDGREGMEVEEDQEELAVGNK